MIVNPFEWINLLLRWTHVFAAILWVGTTYYFTWLDGQLRRAAAHDGNVWMAPAVGRTVRFPSSSSSGVRLPYLMRLM